jgi:hypothetical protein
MKRQHFFILLCLFLILLSGCATDNAKQILENSLCMPPCWYQITPGRSTVNDVRELLPSIEIIDPTTLIWFEKWNIFSGEVAWTYRDSRIGGDIFFVNDIVQSIVFHNYLSIKLKTLISVLGEPEHITFGKPASSALEGYAIDAYILLDTKGVALLVPINVVPETSIEPVNVVKEIIYTDPSNFKNNLGTIFIDKNDFVQRLFPWRGYTKYQTGYR